MARKVRHSALESRSARLKLPVRRKPYPGPSLARGCSLLYRRNRGNGSWVVKVSDGHGGYWTKAFAEADDFDNADGKQVLDYFNAQDSAKLLARAGTAAQTAPITIHAALTDYKHDLESRGADAYNAAYPRVHLTGPLLAKPVMLLTAAELKKWRDSLLGKITPASINRIIGAFRAALELAAQHDERIQNRSAWEIGLAGLPDAQVARNIVISDDKVRAFVASAYSRNFEFGLLADVLAVTGARPSQAIRLRVEDLRDHPVRPKLMMPKSAKGGGRNRSQKKAERFPVPITIGLAAKLKQAAKGRAADALLLVQDNGIPWPSDPSQTYRPHVRAIVTEIGLDPNVVSIYALRHASVVRMLLANVPVRLTASLHDTSIVMVERNYAKYITEHGDDYARGALLQDETPASNVVPLVR